MFTRAKIISFETNNFTPTLYFLYLSTYTANLCLMNLLYMYNRAIIKSLTLIFLIC